MKWYDGWDFFKEHSRKKNGGTKMGKMLIIIEAGFTILFYVVPN